MCKYYKNQKVYVNYQEKKNHDGIVLLGKSKLNTIKVIISKSLIYSYEFVSVNNVLREYDEIKEEIKTFVEYIIQIWLIYLEKRIKEMT